MDKPEFSGVDPTLDACCQREIEGNRKQNALEATLRRHDRIALAERRKRNVVGGFTFGDGCRCCYDPNLDGGEYYELAQLRKKLETNVVNDNDVKDDDDDEKDSNRDSDSDDDSEFDYLLDEELPNPSDYGYGNEHEGGQGNPYDVGISYEQERIEELQLNALIHQSAIHHGFGTHRQLHPLRVLHAAGIGLGGIRGNRAAAIPPAAVIHLYKENEMCASLDLCLEELSKTYKGTKFMRAEGRDTINSNASLVTDVLPKLSVDSGIPALVAVRDGVVVAFCPNLSALGDDRDGRIEPRAVEHWLDNARVLLTDIPLEFEDYCRIRPEEDALLENMMREKAKLDELTAKQMIYNCGVSGCCKTFRHEHIGVKNEQQSGLMLCEEITKGKEVS